MSGIKHPISFLWYWIFSTEMSKESSIPKMPWIKHPIFCLYGFFHRKGQKKLDTQMSGIKHLMSFLYWFFHENVKKSSVWAPLSPVPPALDLQPRAAHLPWIVWNLELGPAQSRAKCWNRAWKVSSLQRAHAVSLLLIKIPAAPCSTWNSLSRVSTASTALNGLTSLWQTTVFGWTPQGSTTCWASQISGIQFPSDTTSFIYSTASASLNMSLVFMFFPSISRNIDWHVCSHALFLLSKTLVRKTLEYEYSSDCGHSAVDILHGGIPAGSCPRQVEQLQTSGPATSLQGRQASFA